MPRLSTNQSIILHQGGTWDLHFPLVRPGYLDSAKLVLATTKNRDHRIYIGQGIFAEVLPHFRGQSFRAWEWTYPDYATPEYITIFNEIRALCKEQILTEGSL